MWLNVGLLLFSFTLLWIGSGIVVSTVNRLAHSIHISSFIVSFFVLGLFTSVTEIMVGISSHLSGEPEIFVGNMIGSSIVIFLLIIPLLAVAANGVKLNHSFKFKDLISAAFVVGLPALFTLDNSFGFIDALTCVAVYCYFVYVQQKNNNTLSRLVLINFRNNTIYKNIGKIIIATIVIFFASNILVEQTKSLGEALNVSSYIISILVVSIGTNIPEISIAARAIYSRDQNIAFGNYLGSASLNTLTLGVLALISNQSIEADGSNYSIILFLIALGLFIYFGKSKNTISRAEGSILLVSYALFVLCELLTGPAWNI